MIVGFLREIYRILCNIYMAKGGFDDFNMNEIDQKYPDYYEQYNGFEYDDLSAKRENIFSLLKDIPEDQQSKILEYQSRLAT